MRFQKVSVDVWRVIITSGSCLFLAFMVWVFLKLAYACVWLPDYLKKQEAQQEESAEDPEDTKKHEIIIDRDIETNGKSEELKKNE